MIEANKPALVLCSGFRGYGKSTRLWEYAKNDKSQLIIWIDVVNQMRPNNHPWPALPTEKEAHSWAVKLKIYRLPRYIKTKTIEEGLELSQKYNA